MGCGSPRPAGAVGRDSGAVSGARGPQAEPRARGCRPLGAAGRPVRTADRGTALGDARQGSAGARPGRARHPRGRRGASGRPYLRRLAAAQARRAAAAAPHGPGAPPRDRLRHLPAPHYASERIAGATLMSRSLRPDSPYAPGSTIAHWTLPQPLAPGDALVVEIDWQARLSTVPGRQGRAGRRFDFAQWYPKVAVYDRYGWETHPLYPAGEVYGELGTHAVTLAPPAGQGIGGTGV